MGFSLIAIGSIDIFNGGTLTIGEDCTVSVHTGIQVGQKYDDSKPASKLVIKPGVKMFFAKYKGYKSGMDEAGVAVKGGVIRAVGGVNKRIWFTSMDQKTPGNGDWGGIIFTNPGVGSLLKHVVIEFAVFGVEQIWEEDHPEIVKYGPPLPGVEIEKSIIRWINIEGIYAERCDFTVSNSQIYQCGNHEIALEHQNHAKIRNCVFHFGRGAINILDSTVFVLNSYFYNYASTSMSQSDIITINDYTRSKRVEILNNKFMAPLAPKKQDLARPTRPKDPEADWPKFVSVRLTPSRSA